jgi:copper transport protein
MRTHWPLRAAAIALLPSLVGGAPITRSSSRESAPTLLARPHAHLVSAEPPADSTLRTSPSRVRLVFSEPIEAKLSRIVIVGPGPDTSRALLKAVADPGDVHAVVATVAQLAAGGYRVQWRVVSTDGHPVTGSYAFSIAAAAAPTPVAPAPADSTPKARDATTIVPVEPGGLWGAPVLAALLRGLGVGSLMAFGGILVLVAWVLPPAGELPGRAALRLAYVAALLLTVHALVWSLNVSPDQRFGAASMTALFSTGAGRREVARVALVVLALLSLAITRRTGLAAVLALAALVVSGDIGHPAAISPALAVPSKAIHLVAGALWLGGLLWLSFADPRVEGYLAGAKRVSSIALVMVILVLLSGAAQTLLFVGSARNLATTPYGVLAFVKAVGLATLVVFGAYHRYVVLPRVVAGGTGAPTKLALSVQQEIAVMIAVILLGGLLAYVPAPRLTG